MKCSFSQPSPVRGTQLVGSKVARIRPATAAALKIPNSRDLESVMTFIYYLIVGSSVAFLHQTESLKRRFLYGYCRGMADGRDARWHHAHLKSLPGAHGQSPHQVILPPPIFVMASTDGRGGILGSKSGQRVAGSLNVDGRSKPLNLLVPSVPGC